MSKKSEMGVGTLIVFIAMLLVAAIAAGVLIQTSGTLQEKSLATGTQAKSQISTNMLAMEVSADDASDGDFERIDTIYKLSPGSDAIKLENTILSESTINTTNTLKYRKSALPINDPFLGYFTASPQARAVRETAFVDPVPAAFWNTFSAIQTSEMLIGKVAVAIVFVESDGSIDTNHENWTTEEEDFMIDAAGDALDFFSAVEPRGGIRHAFEVYRDVPISYEPITRDTSESNQTLWMTEALDHVGAPAGADIFTRTRQFNHQLRMRMNAHWAFTFFVVDSSHTPGGFDDGYAGIAYINGPHTLIASSSYGLNAPALFAHEFGHIFGARDQYASSLCTCNLQGGYYDIETQNCLNGPCVTNTTSLMRSGAETIIAYEDHLIDVFALAQMGLVDGNGNNLADPVDLLFEPVADGADMQQSTINSLAVDGYDQPGRIVGFFSAEYMQQGTNHVDGNLQRGDIVMFSHETARSIAADETVRLSIIPKVGTQTLTEFITPDVMSVEKIYLYP